MPNPMTDAGPRGMGTGAEDVLAGRRKSTTAMRPNRVVRAAIDYAQRGWRIVPVPPGEKSPRLKGWPDRATTDVDQLARWFVGNPNLNVALATGGQSGVVVIDLDGPEGEATWTDLQDSYHPAPATLTCRSPRTDGGRHLYFTHPGGTVRNSTSRLGPGVDVRGDRGACVLPPSWRQEGRYRWQDPSVSVATPPGWLVALLQPPPPRPPSRDDALKVGSPSGRVAALAKVVAGAQEGNRNASLNWAAFVLRDDVAAGRIGLEDAWETLAVAGMHAGLGAGEVRATLASGFGREVRQ